MVENAFLTDQCTKFIFALLVCWFYLIRTQAFSVFSRCHVAAPQWDRTIHASESQNQQTYEQKRRPVDDLVFIPPEFTSSISSCLSLSFSQSSVFIASFPLTHCRADFVLCCPTLKHSWHQCTAAALYLHKVIVCVVWSLKIGLKTSMFSVILLLQGFCIMRMKSFLGYYFRMIRMTS